MSSAPLWNGSPPTTHKAGVQAVHAELETVVSANSKLGSGRADGLVASLMPDGSVYTAALEAKSARTLPNIMLRYGDGLWMLHALIAGLLGMVVAASIGWFLIDSWWLRCIVPPVAFFAVGLAYPLLTAEHARYRLIDVVRQVKRYPANEQWIAVSVDAYNELDDSLQEALRTDCRKEGLGLLRVRSTWSFCKVRTLPRKIRTRVRNASIHGLGRSIGVLRTSAYSISEFSQYDLVTNTSFG